MRLIHAILFLVAALTIVAGELDNRMASAGMLPVAMECDGVEIDLMYSRSDNFTGAVIYPEGSMTTAWLHPEAIKALTIAAKALKSERPDLHLLIKDASRPMSAQKQMYQTVRGTSKARYVSNPANGGGLHNYGLAVDITLADSLGNELNMGTPVDHLGSEANIDKEHLLVKRGVITAEAKANRELLRRVMLKGGWNPLRSEWWHFNLCTRREARQRYKLLNF